jgi:hypothetical protein
MCLHTLPEFVAKVGQKWLLFACGIPWCCDKHLSSFSHQNVGWCHANRDQILVFILHTELNQYRKIPTYNVNVAGQVG